MDLYGRLIVHVEGCADLPDTDTWGGASDPYCIIKVDGVELGRTDVCQDDGAPVWQEDFYVNLEGKGEQLFFEVWDADTCRTDDLLGFLTVPVSEIQATTDGECHMVTKDLQTSDGSPTGTITYSLQFREFGGEIKFSGEGKKKSVHVGINYLDLPPGKGQLRGCFNDVERLHGLVVDRYGFDPDNTRILRDDDPDNMPTRANIEEAIAWLTADVEEGDSLVFQFSGHGGQVKDLDGDEEDAHDETIIPCDFRTHGMITDDDLFKMLVAPLPSGVMLTAVMDCCHSGTGMDLAFIHKVGRDEDGVTRSMGGFEMKKALATEETEQNITAQQTTRSYDDTSDANVIMLSGCMDHQTSADASIEGMASGAMTYALLTALEEMEYECSYETLLVKMYDILDEGSYSQKPQLSTARPFNLQSSFVV